MFMITDLVTGAVLSPILAAISFKEAESASKYRRNRVNIK